MTVFQWKDIINMTIVEVSSGRIRNFYILPSLAVLYLVQKYWKWIKNGNVLKSISSSIISICSKIN